MRQTEAEVGEGDGADEAAVAHEFMAGLLEAFGAEVEVTDRDLGDGLVEIGVTGSDLGVLIGPRGQTLLAVQELARTVVQRHSRGAAGRIVVDISGYRQARREALTKFATEVANQVLESGVARVLEPMPAPDRKVVHDTVNRLAGVETISEGEEPRRRIVISPIEAGGVDVDLDDDDDDDDGDDDED